MNIVLTLLFLLLKPLSCSNFFKYVVHQIIHDVSFLHFASLQSLWPKPVLNQLAAHYIWCFGLKGDVLFDSIVLPKEISNFRFKRFCSDLCERNDVVALHETSVPSCRNRRDCTGWSESSHQIGEAGVDADCEHIVWRQLSEHRFRSQVVDFDPTGEKAWLGVDIVVKRRRHVILWQHWNGDCRNSEQPSNNCVRLFVALQLVEQSIEWWRWGGRAAFRGKIESKSAKFVHIIQVWLTKRMKKKQKNFFFKKKTKIIKNDNSSQNTIIQTYFIVLLYFLIVSFFSFFAL